MDNYSKDDYLKYFSSDNLNYDNNHYDRLLPFYKDYFDSKTIYNIAKGSRWTVKTSSFVSLCVHHSYVNRPNSKIVMIREYASTLETSLYSTTLEIIDEYDTIDNFEPIKSSKKIVNKRTGNEMIFVGLAKPENLKGLSNVSTLYIDECDKLTYNTLRLTIDTAIRGSTIKNTDKNPPKMYFSFNPYNEIDPIIKFVNEQKKSNVLTKHITIYDLPETHQNQNALSIAESLKTNNFPMYRHHALGEPHPFASKYPFKQLKKVSYNNLKRLKPQHQPFMFSKAYLDLAFSSNNDYTALSILSSDPSGENYLIGFAWRRSWDSCINDIEELLKIFNVEAFYYEDNLVKELPANMFKTQFDRIAVGDTSKKGKLERIKSIGFICSELFLTEISSEDKLYQANYDYNNMLIEWNEDATIKSKLGFNDDAPDSLAGLIRIIFKVD